MDIQLKGCEKRRIPRQSLTEMADARQLRDPVGVVVPRRVPGALPRITQLMEGAPEGLARDPKAALRRQLQRERLATPARPAPAIGLWRPLEHGHKRTLPTEQLGRRLGGRRRAPSAVDLPALISGDGAINARARAEETVSNLRRRVPLRTQEQDVESKQVAVAGLAQLAEHPLLFFAGNLKYGFSRHRRFFSDHQFASTYRCIRKNSSVPISCASI